MDRKRRLTKEEKISNALKNHPCYKNPERGKKISATKTKQFEDEEYRKYYTDRNKGTFQKGHKINSGKKYSEERVQKAMSVKRKNDSFKHTEETKKKLSISHKGKTPWNKGIPMRPETKIKLSKALKGHPAFSSPERCRKLKETRKRQILPFKDTKPERLMQEILTTNNIQFKKHVPLYGQPDIFIDPKLCIFVDGVYWHHYPTGTERDKKVNNKLRNDGYIVLRFWETQIYSNINNCLNDIKSYIGDGIEC